MRLDPRLSSPMKEAHRKLYFSYGGKPYLIVGECDDEPGVAYLCLCITKGAYEELQRVALAHRTWDGAWTVLDARVSTLLPAIDNYVEGETA
jgi:hypothetical protein